MTPLISGVCELEGELGEEVPLVGALGTDAAVLWPTELGCCAGAVVVVVPDATTDEEELVTSVAGKNSRPALLAIPAFDSTASTLAIFFEVTTTW
jgi:hypothetical protein